MAFFKSVDYRLLLCLCSALLAPWAAQASTFPSRPIDIVVGFPPGGGADVMARIVAKALSADIKQSVIVENQAGANGIIAEGAVARSKPDGYTLFFGSAGNISVNPVLYKKLPFDVSRDFAPMTKVADAPLVLVVNPAVPVHSLKELIALEKKQPTAIKFSSSGIGSLLHLGGELLNTDAHINMMHVPYRGSAPSITAVVAGQVQAAVDTVLLTQPFIKSGKLRALAVLGKDRSPLLPDVPTVAETIPGFDVPDWWGMLVPAKTPEKVQEYLHRKLVEVLNSSAVRTQFAKLGATPAPTSQKEFGHFMQSEMSKWGKVVKVANVHVD